MLIERDANFNFISTFRDFVIKLNTFCLLSDGHGCSGADNWSAGADHSATHDPSSWKTTPVGVF